MNIEELYDELKEQVAKGNGALPVQVSTQTTGEDLEIESACVYDDEVFLIET